jgi:hypothetical protein
MNSADYQAIEQTKDLYSCIKTFLIGTTLVTVFSVSAVSDAIERQVASLTAFDVDANGC